MFASLPPSLGLNPVAKKKSGEMVFASPMDMEIYNCRTLGLRNGKLSCCDCVV